MKKIVVFDDDESLSFEIEVRAEVDAHDLMNPIEEALNDQNLFSCRKCGVFVSTDDGSEDGLDDNDYCRKCP